MIENYEISNVSNVRNLSITFPGGLDVVMPSPYAGVIKTYRVFELSATYAGDEPAEWSAGVTTVFKTAAKTPDRPTIFMRSHTFEPQIREKFTKLVESLDIRDERERRVS